MSELDLVDPTLTPAFDALLYRWDLESEGIPGGATPVDWQPLDYWTVALYRWWKAEHKNAGEP